jgi:hypothetical protein
VREGYFDLLVADGFGGGVDEGVLLEAEGDFELVVVGAGEVDADGGHWYWFLGLGQTEFDHESGWIGRYLT